MMFSLWAGCAALEDLVVVDDPCDDFVEVDASTGAASLVLDDSCDRDGVPPDRAEYLALADRQWDLLVDEDADPCGKGGSIVLTIDLPGGELSVDPTLEASYPDGFVQGVWMEVSYWGGNSSAATWSSFFRLGRDEVLDGVDCP
jgi:hypothetical protein